MRLLIYTTVLFLAAYGGTAARRTVPCDKSLIEGFNENTMEFIANNLTCKSSAHLLKFEDRAGHDIESEQLECGATHWTTNEGSTGIRNTKEIAVSCVRMECDRRLLSNMQGVRFDEPSQAKDGFDAKLSCTEQGHALLIDGKLYKELLCTKGEGWKKMKGTIAVNAAISRFSVECVRKACHPALINLNLAVVNTIIPAELTCKNDLLGLTINGGDSKFDKLVCDAVNGWRSNPSEVLGIDAEATFRVNCEKRACDKSLISDHDKLGWSINIYNKVKVTYISCLGQQEMLIGGQFYKSLVCTESDGWTESKNFVKEATEKFAANCVQKACHPTLVKIWGTSPMPIPAPNSVSFSCQGPKRELRVGITSSSPVNGGIISSSPIEKESFGRILTCDKKEGWKVGSEPFANAIKKVNVECVALTCDESLLTFPKEENKPTFIDNGDFALLSCKEHESILIDGSSFRPSSILCEKTGSWTSITKRETFELAGQEFTAECVVKACHKKLISTTSELKFASSSVNVNKKPVVSLDVSCANENQELRMVLPSGDIGYSEKFTCNTAQGWRRGNEVYSLNTNPKDVVELECVPKSCDLSLISSTNDSIAEVNIDGNSLTCGDSKITLVYNHTPYEKIICAKEKQWRSGKNEILANANETIVVDCILKACDARLISKGPNVMVLEGEPLKLNCSKKGLDLHIANTATYHSQMSCDPTKGWTDGVKSIKNSWDRFNIECVPGNCNIDLIEFAPEKVQILPSNADSRYTHAVCVNEHERLFANGNFRKSLECDEASSGWKDGNTPIGKLPRDKITIECKLPNCDAVFVKNGNSEILFDFRDLEDLRQQYYPELHSISDLPSNEKAELEEEQRNRKVLSCRHKSQVLRVNGAYKVDTIECSIKENTWLGVEAAGDNDIKVECIEVCQWSIPRSSKSKMKKDDIVRTLIPPETLIYYCQSRDVPRLLVHNGKKHTSLQCSLHEGWLDGGREELKDDKGEMIAVDSEIELGCEDYCTTFTEKPDDFLVKVNSDRLDVQCKNQSFAIRTKNAPENQVVPEMSCTYRGGWQGPPGTPQISHETQRQLHFECHKVCTVESTMMLNESYDDKANGTKSIKCLDGKTLYVNGNPSRPLTCNAHDGWRDAEDPAVHYSRHDSPNFACSLVISVLRKSVRNEETEILANPSIPAWQCSKLPVERRNITPKQEGPGKFSCKNKTIGTANNGIKLNGAFVHSQLKCDILRGWLDVVGKQLAGSEEMVDLECDTVKCTTFGLNQKCSDYNKKYPEIFREYACTMHDFDNDIDPNLRVCGAKQRLLTERGGLVEKGLRCTDDGSWHTIGDEKKVRTADNKTAVFCVQKRCSMCSKPTIFGDANYYTSDPIYVEGSMDACAEATCRSGLWVVSEGGKTVEYVAKSLICSSVNESKWELRDGKFADNIACVSQFETCTAFQLNTECDFTFANCSEISLDHNKNNFCPGDTLMFYKNRSELVFKDQNDERKNQHKLSIRCNGGKGWIVHMGKYKIDVIDQGGHVICAAQNPLPVIKVTTTKAPILVACKACPTPIQFRLNCPECSQQGPDIALETSSDADKCYAKSVTGGGIISEKLGHIEGKLECQLNNPVWKHKGTEVGKFAASVKSKEADNSQGQIQFSTAVILILFVSSMVGDFF